MASVVSQFAVELDQFLAPISPDYPCGADLRYDPVYDHIRDLRRQEDPNVPQGVWQTTRKHADWTAVASECLRVLEVQSKDLQIAAWLLEAWVHLHGFAGAAEGLRVMHALCGRFWDYLHPCIQDGDSEFRVAPVVWLNDRLPIALKLISLTAPESTDICSYGLADWEKASQAETQRSTDGKAKPPAITFAQLQQSAMLTSFSRLHSTLQDVRRLIRYCAEFDHFLDEKLGREAPGLMPVRTVGEAVGNLIANLIRERGGNDHNPKLDTEPALQGATDILDLSNALMYAKSPNTVEEQPHSDVSVGRIDTRALAYQLLGEAADFLARTEPHSPAPYLVRRAITWGAMSFEELLPEFIRNQAELGEIYRLLDVRSVEATKK